MLRKLDSYDVWTLILLNDNTRFVIVTKQINLCGAYEAPCNGSKIPVTPKGARVCDENFLSYLD